MVACDEAGHGPFQHHPPRFGDRPKSRLQQPNFTSHRHKTCCWTRQKRVLHHELRPHERIGMKQACLSIVSLPTLTGRQARSLSTRDDSSVSKKNWVFLTVQAECHAQENHDCSLQCWLCRSVASKSLLKCFPVIPYPRSSTTWSWFSP